MSDMDPIVIEKLLTGVPKTSEERTYAKGLLISDRSRPWYRDSNNDQKKAEWYAYLDRSFPAAAANARKAYDPRDWLKRMTHETGSTRLSKTKELAPLAPPSRPQHCSKQSLPSTIGIKEKIQAYLSVREGQTWTCLNSICSIVHSRIEMRPRLTTHWQMDVGELGWNHTLCGW